MTKELNVISSVLTPEMEMNIHPLNKYSSSKGDYPYYSIISHKFWKNKNTGKEVSIYRVAPYSYIEEEKNWEIVDKGFTIRNNKNGYIAAYLDHFETINAAVNWIKSFWDKKQGYDPSSKRIDMKDKKLSIKMIEGYDITSTEKKGFDILFREYFTKGIKSGRVGRTDYFLEPTEDDNIFSCKTIKMKTSFIGAPPAPQHNKFILKVIVK